MILTIALKNDPTDAYYVTNDGRLINTYCLNEFTEQDIILDSKEQGIELLEKIKEMYPLDAWYLENKENIF